MGITQNDLPKHDLKVILVILLKCILFFIIIHFLWDCTMFKKIMVYTFICIAIVTSGTIQCVLLNIIDMLWYFLYIYIYIYIDIYIDITVFYWIVLCYKYYPVVLFIINNNINNNNCCCCWSSGVENNLSLYLASFGHEMVFNRSLVVLAFAFKKSALTSAYLFNLKCVFRGQSGMFFFCSSICIRHWHIPPSPNR